MTSLQASPPTLVVRRCSRCDGIFGLHLWRWSGALVATSHGFCRACYGELESELGPGPVIARPRRARRRGSRSQAT